jgi:hypothetical protein
MSEEKPIGLKESNFLYEIRREDELVSKFRLARAEIVQAAKTEMFEEACSLLCPICGGLRTATRFPPNGERSPYWIHTFETGPLLCYAAGLREALYQRETAEATT